jgi:hypothetical protein
MSLLFVTVDGILLPVPASMKCKDRRIYVTPVRTDMQSLYTNRSAFFTADAKLQLTFTVHRNVHSSYGFIIVVHEVY